MLGGVVVSHDVKERRLAEMQLLRREAADLMQREIALAEASLSRFDVRIHDWRAVRFAEALLRYYDERCAQAEAALKGHDEKGKGTTTQT